MTAPNFFALVLLGISIFILPHPAAAQTAADIDNAARQTDNIQRQQLLRQQEDTARNLSSKREPTTIIAPIPAQPVPVEGGCRNIRTITINNAWHLTHGEERKLQAPYKGKCLGVTEIQTLMAEITTLYIQKGYATARAYLPQQDLSTGTLMIDVLEGEVSDIRTAPNGNDTVSIATAFPGVEGRVLNLRDIEQGLDQINRLVSNNATMDIVPGKGVGESEILIRNEPGKRWHVNVTGDNYGPKTTGREQVGATVTYDNLLGLNEFYSYTRRQSVPFNDRRKQSTSNSVLFSIPYGYSSLFAGYSDSDYNSTLSTPGGLDLSLSGDNRAVFATLDQVVYRSQESKANLSATITEKTTRNFIEDQRLDVSSRTLTVLDLGGTYTTSFLGGSASIGGGYSRGLKALGALNDPAGLPSSAPRAQFSKLSLNGVYTRPFEAAGESLLYSGQLTGQYGLDPLYGSEQFQIGGIYSVRGFYDESLANDHGVLLRNDLTLLETLGEVGGQTISLRPYIGFDVGATGGRVRKTSSGVMAGTVVGLSVALGPAFFDIYTGHPVTAPSDVENEGFNTFARLSLNF